MFFDVAGGGPFSEFHRTVFVGVLDDGVEDFQGDASAVRGVFQAAGGAGLSTHGGAGGGDGGFKGGDVRAELGEEGGGQAEADELGLVGGGVGGERAGRVEPGLVAAAAGQAEFAIESRGAEQGEGVRGFADALEVFVEVEAAGDFGERVAVGLFRAGGLRGTEAGGLWDGGMDEGELLPTYAGGWKIGGVFEAEGVHVLEGCGEAGDLLVHGEVLCGLFGLFPFR